MKAERPFSLTPQGASGSLSISRWNGQLLLNTFGALVVEPLLDGLEPVRVDEWRWRLAGEADARRLMQRLIEAWPIARLEVCLTREGLPGVCHFCFDVNTNEVNVTPELEHHRDEQRAVVPRAEAWLQQVLERAVDAKPVWSAEWRITRAEMMTLLAGPMDPFG